MQCMLTSECINSSNSLIGDILFHENVRRTLVDNCQVCLFIPAKMLLYITDLFYEFYYTARLPFANFFFKLVRVPLKQELQFSMKK